MQNGSNTASKLKMSPNTGAIESMLIVFEVFNHKHAKNSCINPNIEYIYFHYTKYVD